MEKYECFLPKDIENWGSGEPLAAGTDASDQ
jgi:hypothetical protein